MAKVRIAETEAYDQSDPASHSFRGVTPRNQVMFGHPGHLYVYLIYGMHFCMNVVTDDHGTGSAVLLRAAEPLVGIAAMEANRSSRRPVSGRTLLSGPARLCQALGVDRSMDGLDLSTSDVIWIEQGQPPAKIVTTPRIGISRGADARWRFFGEADPWVSSARPSVAGSPRRRIDR